jgi:hypothetical protein
MREVMTANVSSGYGGRLGYRSATDCKPNQLAYPGAHPGGFDSTTGA